MTGINGAFMAVCLVISVIIFLRAARVRSRYCAPTR